MQSSSSLVAPTYVLITIATTMIQVALYDRQGLVPHEWVHLAFVLAMAWMIRRSEHMEDRKFGRAVSATCFVTIAVLPFVIDVIQRAASPFGYPFEVQIVLALRNLMIGLAAQRRDPRSLTFAALASGFLALYGFLWLLNRWTVTLVFVYAIIGMWWLMGTYWDRLSGCFVTRSERQIPWKPVIGAVACGLIALVASLPLVVGKNYTTALQGFLPSSGGTGGQDKHAFGGVGDGPQMVSARENASGFGPIESELFLESKMPSLYDTINEFSDSVPKPKKKGFQRAIPLAPTQMQENHQRRGTTQRPGREFNTVRRQKNPTRKVKDLRSHALLQVIGRVPVHLGLYTYDTWNGRELVASDSGQVRELKLHVEMTSGKKWARFSDSTTNECLSHHEHHELRVINLKTDRIPAPPNFYGANIDKIHSASMFKPTPDGMLRLDMDRIPQLSVLHVESLQRRASQVPQPVRGKPDASNADDAFSTLARSWTDDVDEGWSQIEAVCSRMQSEYTLDRESMVPEDVEDAANYFLTESKRGPDYLFATSTALMLRTLGYETRVVSGFFADAKNFDRRSRITSIYADDAHFWVEVLATAEQSSDAKGSSKMTNYWVAVDPSPGYEVLLAPESLWSQMLARASSTWLPNQTKPVAIARRPGHHRDCLGVESGPVGPGRHRLVVLCSPLGRPPVIESRRRFSYLSDELRRMGIHANRACRSANGIRARHLTAGGRMYGAIRLSNSRIGHFTATAYLAGFPTKRSRHCASKRQPSVCNP